MPEALQSHVMLIDHMMSTVSQSTTINLNQEAITYLTDGSSLNQQCVGGELSNTWTITGILDPTYPIDTDGRTLTEGPLVYHPKVPVQGDRGIAVQVPIPTNYAPGHQVGQLRSFSWGMTGSGQLLFGRNVAPWAARTSSGNSGGYQLGAATASQTIYYIVQCDDNTISGTSPTLDITIESAATDSWPGTTRFTVAQITDAGAAWKYDSLAGAVTDTWWRVNWTIGGTSPSFPFQVYMAIA